MLMLLSAVSVAGGSGYVVYKKRKSARLASVSSCRSVQDSESRFGRDDRYAYYAVLLYDFMEKKKPYLCDTFSTEIAMNEIGTNRTTLSRIVSMYFGCNFPTFVNRFRLRTAVQIMETHRGLTMVQVASMSGFGSTNIFHAIFKLEFGATPLELLSHPETWKQRTAAIKGSLWVRKAPDSIRKR